MSGHDEAHTSTMQRPTADDRDAWQGYWRGQGQPWRTEPEIDLERQRALTAHVTTLPGGEQNPSPFKDMPLSRADVEWLLATHEGGDGPVIWEEVDQRTRVGLNLCGADLRRVDLSGLPLARLRAGLPWFRRNFHTSEQLDEAGARLERANLRGTHLEGAVLRRAHLEHADLRGAFLPEADLSRAHLESATKILPLGWRRTRQPCEPIASWPSPCRRKGSMKRQPASPIGPRNSSAGSCGSNEKWDSGSSQDFSMCLRAMATNRGGALSPTSSSSPSSPPRTTSSVTSSGHPCLQSARGCSA